MTRRNKNLRSVRTLVTTKDIISLAWSSIQRKIVKVIL